MQKSNVLIIGPKKFVDAGLSLVGAMAEKSIRVVDCDHETIRRAEDIYPKPVEQLFVFKNVITATAETIHTIFELTKAEKAQVVCTAVEEEGEVRLVDLALLNRLHVIREDND